MTTFTSITDFTPDKFTPTKWEGADKKAKFARQFIKFVQSDFANSHFSNTFYLRLALCFGHIVHFNRHGFFETFFTTTDGKVRFLRMTLAHPCWSDPAFTYSDVERALQIWLREGAVLSKYEQRLVDEQKLTRGLPWLVFSQSTARCRTTRSRTNESESWTSSCKRTSSPLSGPQQTRPPRWYERTSWPRNDTPALVQRTIDFMQNRFLVVLRHGVSQRTRPNNKEQESARLSRTGQDSRSLPKSSDPDSRHQKQPDFRQQRRKRLPDPHGQRSFRPSFSPSSLCPWTMRTPRFTFVSDGKPLRRLLIVSKKMASVRGLAGP
jgi:hypothetical protein